MAKVAKRTAVLGPSAGPTLRELEEGLKIDRNALEREWEEQAELFYRVASAYEMSISLRDEAEQNVKKAEAEADADIRAESKDKLTEAYIKTQVRLHKGVQVAEAEYIRLREECGIYGALKDAYRQRSYAISGLVELYCANYFALKSKSDEFFSKPKRAAAREAMAEGRRQRAV